MDEDVFQVVPKTLVQQKQSKDYRQKVDSYNAAIAKERSRKRKIKTWFFDYHLFIFVYILIEVSFKFWLSSGFSEFLKP